MLKGFPNETFLNPKYSNLLKNFEWIKKLDPNNAIIKFKEDFLRKRETEHLLPSVGFLLEEKMYNPFLRLEDPFYQDLLETTDKTVMLKKLKAFEKLSLESK